MLLLIALAVFLILTLNGEPDTLGGAVFASFFNAACVYVILF